MAITTEAGVSQTKFELVQTISTCPEALMPLTSDACESYLVKMIDTWGYCRRGATLEPAHLWTRNHLRRVCCY